MLVQNHTHHVARYPNRVCFTGKTYTLKIDVYYEQHAMTVETESIMTAAIRSLLAKHLHKSITIMSPDHPRHLLDMDANTEESLTQKLTVTKQHWQTMGAQMTKPGYLLTLDQALFTSLPRAFTIFIEGSEYELHIADLPHVPEQRDAFIPGRHIMTD